MGLKEILQMTAGMAAMFDSAIKPRSGKPSSGRSVGKRMSPKDWEKRQSRIRMQKQSRKTNRIK